MTGSRTRRWLGAALLAGSLLAPNPVLEPVSSAAIVAAPQAMHARGRGPGPGPARRAPRRTVRHERRHDRHEYRDDRRDEVRRARRGRAITRAVVGTRVRTQPRGCTTIVTDDIIYRECSGVYYRRYYERSTVVYVVVEAP